MDNDEIREEYRSFGGVNFLNTDMVTMHDSQGNIILCKCGNPAVSGCFGENSFICWCNDCPISSTERVQFIYKPPEQK